ncbi:hypothetical protein ACFSL6_11110 [Paenibacillus thailandensis]|uniref:IDEAL domain-containing protein n=1 Tax=Paenibacillus thailandensis TaxID=393250 RepID=A0ABW5QTQ0_9BACL
MNPNLNLTLWMTEFLRSSDQDKKALILEAKQTSNGALLESIRFHLDLRDKLHLFHS